MSTQAEKCVLVLDRASATGLLANTAAILGVTLGSRVPEIVGRDVTDGDGGLHPGIVEFPIPVLEGDAAVIRGLRDRLAEPEFDGVLEVDFSALAQSCRTYGEFVEKMARTPETDLDYLGLALCGSKKQINRLTGNLPLLR